MCDVMFRIEHLYIAVCPEEKLCTKSFIQGGNSVKLDKSI